jgi:hypothetical protein
MFIVSLTDADHERRLPFACMRPLQTTHVTDIEFEVHAPSTDTVRARLKAYPRRTEPVVALLARCLALVHGSLPLLGHADAYHLQLLEGETVQSAQLIETLDVQLGGDMVTATWEDAIQRRCIDSPARRVYLDGGNLVEHAARLVSWCVDDVPPLPAPLDIAVTVRERQGVPCVEADDIPGFARQCFATAQGAQPRPRPGAFYAHDWFDFLTS